MQVESAISFKSRNYEIRIADDIAREISRKYPLISSSKLGSFPNAEKFKDSFVRLHENLLTTRQNVIERLEIHPLVADRPPKDKILGFMKIMKKDKLGNCGEMASMAMLFTYLRGIKDTHIADLRNSQQEVLDHEVLLVDNDKKPYIIDTWLGFADYLPNAIQKYKSVFNYIFHFEKYSAQDFEFHPYSSTSYIRRHLNKCSERDLRIINERL